MATTEMDAAATTRSPPADDALRVDMGIGESHGDRQALCPSTSATAAAAARVDPRANRFPFCIVWSPLPVITWFLPFIGHLGIATSDGIIYDFAGPYTIGREHFAFGAPTRFLPCAVAPEQAEKWDRAVQRGCAIYETRMHNLCCDNCHSHVATCLEHMQYRGVKRWNMVMLCFWMFFCGRYVGVAGFVKSWAPFAVVLLIVLLSRAAA